MGKFKLSDMLPNAWFYKLKHNSSSRGSSIATKKPQQIQSNNTAASQASKMQQPYLVTHPRKSYHFTRDQSAAVKQQQEPPSTFDGSLATTTTNSTRYVYPDTPRKSSKKRRSTKRSRQQPSRLVASSVSAGCSCRATIESVWTKPDSTPEDYPSSPLDSSSGNESLLPRHGSALSLAPETFDGMLSLSTSSCNCRVNRDFVLEMENKPSIAKTDEAENHHLPPIVTNKSSKVIKNRSSAKLEEKTAHGSISVKVIKEDVLRTTREQKSNQGRKSVHSPGVKLRTNSPRIAAAGRRIQGRRSLSSYSNSSSTSSRRTNLSESFAVVKSSKDPRKDFRESMVEMILENNIFESKELEDLLACYLSLNSDEYHEMIIKVFKQIWFDIIDPKLK